jgi:hypothetical protein
MTDPTPYIARLGLARDQLAEARRYVRTQSQAATEDPRGNNDNL